MSFSRPIDYVHYFEFAPAFWFLPLRPPDQYLKSMISCKAAGPPVVSIYIGAVHISTQTLGVCSAGTPMPDLIICFNLDCYLLQSVQPLGSLGYLRIRLCLSYSVAQGHWKCFIYTFHVFWDWCSRNRFYWFIYYLNSNGRYIINSICNISQGHLDDVRSLIFLQMKVYI